MAVTSRQLQIPKTLRAAEVGKRTIAQSGLSPSAMSRWAELNIIGLLNGEPSRGRERVTWIVEACQQVIRLHESVKFSDAPHSGAPAPNRDALFADIDKILPELNERLSKYKCLPVVRYDASPDGCFDVQYLFLAPSSEDSEHIAVSFVMDHIHAIHRIRRCDRSECRKWFFAVTDHQKYCGDKCRKRDAAQGESFKERRRLYMKKYRSEDSEREARAKRLAKGKSK